MCQAAARGDTMPVVIQVSKHEPPEATALKELAIQMTSYNPTDRPTVDDVKTTLMNLTG